MDFGLREFGEMDEKDRVSHYRRFVHMKGGRPEAQGEGRRKGDLRQIDRFRYRTRYFTDSGILGTREFVELASTMPWCAMFSGRTLVLVVQPVLKPVGPSPATYTFAVLPVPLKPPVVTT